MDHLTMIKKKLLNLEELKQWLAIWNFQNKRVVFTDGCFDILHRGHIEYLAQAASLGNVLIVGLHSDSSVARLKGEGRPILDFATRALMLSAIGCISAVVCLDDDSPYELIKLVQPNVLVKGADKISKDIVGYDIVSAKAGRVVTIDMVEGQSSEILIGKIRQ